MKALKMFAIAIVATCFFSAANAQVIVRARIGTPPPPHRVIVEHRPPVVYHPSPVVVYHRPVAVYHRPYYSRVRYVSRPVAVRTYRRY